MSKITIDRAVVEQALEALEHAEQDSADFQRINTDQTGESIATLRAALEQPRPETGIPASVPTGWKLVPEEPTPKMVDAACQDGISLDGRPVWKHTVDVQAEWRWKQMLAAAPQPPVVEQEPVAEVIVSHTRAGLNGQYTAEVASRERLSVGAELFIHPQNLRCKSTQARLATLWGYVKERPQQEQEWKRRLGNLLAVIHGDGGHYIDAHGWDKAQVDAEEKVARVMTGLPQSASVVWPRNASEVRAFLSGHVAAERYARDDHQPDDSDTYTLSAHDLLGAIDWWTDFDQRPCQPLTDEQIDAAHDTLFPKPVYDRENVRIFARAIERAHEIGGEK